MAGEALRVTHIMGRVMHRGRLHETRAIQDHGPQQKSGDEL